MEKPKPGDWVLFNAKTWLGPQVGVVVNTSDTTVIIQCRSVKFYVNPTGIISIDKHKKSAP